MTFPVSAPSWGDAGDLHRQRWTQEVALRLCVRWPTTGRSGIRYEMSSSFRIGQAFCAYGSWRSPGQIDTRFSRLFGQRLPMVSLDFEYVPAIERSPSGKRRYLLNDLETVGSELPTNAPIADALFNESIKAASRWYWLAAVTVVFVIAVAVASVLALGACGSGHHETVRAHRAHAPPVHVKAPGPTGSLRSSGY